MTAISFLELKQSLSRVSETERRELSAFLIRLGQQRPSDYVQVSRRIYAKQGVDEIFERSQKRARQR